MMTAAQIASEFGVAEVKINYLATEFKSEWYVENPMSRMEWAKYGFDFKAMQRQNSEYSSDWGYFPEDVTIID